MIAGDLVGGEGLATGATRRAAARLVRCAPGEEAFRTLPHLEIRPPGERERVVPVGEELLIGRAPGAGLRVRDGAASRRHARIRVAPTGEATVEDLSSKNGTRLNDLPLAPGAHPLRPGDRLGIGELTLRYVDPLEGADQERPAAPAAPTDRGEETRRPEALLAGALLAAAAAIAALLTELAGFPG